MVPVPGVLGPFSFSCVLLISSKSLPGGIEFPECVVNPSFFPDLLSHVLLAGSLPEIIVADGIWPVDVHEPPQAAANECFLVL